MSSSYFPLHWESTGNKWWHASPIDLAAAHGHYDIVRELLHFDMNLLIKLTSLRRIRRLETLWDDENHFFHAAKCRSFVARNLLLECETKNNKNRLIRAGYGGWLMYTACSAGDNGFVRELLERDPFLVFGEGEYGVADILYAAARSKSNEVFKMIFELAIEPRCLVGEKGGSNSERDSILIMRSEIVNRAVFAAARGGNLEVLKELIGESSDVLAYSDNQGATILHASAGRGQVQVVNDLVETFNIIECRDNEGNTALHIASFRGHLPVIKTLISASASLPFLTNNVGDTFIHMAVAGFQLSDFRRLDRQMELVRYLISENIVNIQDIINIQNSNGRTALHSSVTGTLHSDLVELLMTIPSIDINIQDINGMTPLDLLSRRVPSASSNLLIKKFFLAGGIANSNRSTIRSTNSSLMKIKSCTGNSPGTSFRITDSEIFLYTGIDTPVASERLSSTSTDESEYQAIMKKPTGSLNNAAKMIRNLFSFPRRKEKKKDDDFQDSVNSTTRWSEQPEIPTPLRQTFSSAASSSPLNYKRNLATSTSMPSPATKKKFTLSLSRGVFQSMSPLASFSKPQTPVSPFSCSKVSSPVSEKLKNGSADNENVENDGDSICSNSSVYSHSAHISSQRSGFMNEKSMNKYSVKSFPPGVCETMMNIC